MGERKVLNKYIPPDFDPSLLPRRKRPKNNQETVRMMMPMSVQCNTCGEYMYMGKKFNSRKETVEGETYLGIKIYRFYMKCTGCCSEFTIKTDPRHSDYVCEMGVSRNFEPWREADQENEQEKKAKEDLEMDTMLSLEARTEESKREMDTLDALDEIRTLNARTFKVTPDELLASHARKAREHERTLDEKDEQLVQKVFGGAGSEEVVQRIQDDEEGTDEEGGAAAKPPPASFSFTTPALKKRERAPTDKKAAVMVVRQKNPTPKPQAKPASSSTEKDILGLAAAYSSGSDVDK